MVDTTAYDSNATTTASGIITGLAVLFTALRFYTRVHMKAGIKADDWWCLAGLLSYLLTGGLLLWSVNLDPLAEKAISKAISTNSTTTFDSRPHTTYLKLSFTCTILYFSVVTAIKISILLMYRRIFSIDPTFRLQSLLVGIVVLAFWLAATIATVFNCLPVKYNWIGLVLEGRCFNFNIFWMVTGSVEVVIDTIILALPVRMVLGLQMSRKQKASIVFVFLLGSFVIITGIIRVIYGYIPGSRAPEYTKSGLWSTVHIIMGIICACLPTLRPLFPRTTSLLSNTSSALRRKYYDLKGSHDYRRDGSGFTDSGLRSAGSRARSVGKGGVSVREEEEPIEVVPLRRREVPDREGERESGSCDVSLRDGGARMEIENVPIGRQDCLCGANKKANPNSNPDRIVSVSALKDPRVQTVWLSRQRERGW